MQMAFLFDGIQRSIATLKNATRHVFRPRRPAGGQVLVPKHSQFWSILGVITAAIIVLMLFFDADIVYWKRQNLSDHGAVVQTFQYITHLGSSGWILIGCAVLALYLSAKRWSDMRFRQKATSLSLYADATFLFWTSALAGTSASLIKNFLGRARPKMLDELGPLHFNTGAFESTFASFPSGHSTTTGALAAALILIWPRLWPVWAIIGLLGGVSRIFVGAHYPSDVIAGLTFGALFVIFTARWLALRGVMFAFNDGWIPYRRERRQVPPWGKPLAAVFRS